MQELSVNNQLRNENLFDLFKRQLIKDFESSGFDSEFVTDLPSDFEALKTLVIKQLQPQIKNSSGLLNTLLYRVDISESQLMNYQRSNRDLPYVAVLAELIIKRELQKIILKKKFSQ